jgi:hypothetical protein
MINFEEYFGVNFLDVNERIKSYDLIENFIAASHINWAVAPNTPTIVKEFKKIISKLNDKEFAFLVVHTGYIPENYAADSSQETLYSKLIETIVLEWAIRIGFSGSVLPTQKSSMEDVSILKDEYVIVCDAKSFRLGRSQSAPNVKDVLKHSDIKKWLGAYPGKTQLGGLVTFPSQHDWKSGSDFYQYTTDKSSPTASLYYEHLAFFLISGMSFENLIDLYQAYPRIFPNKINKNQNNKSEYYKRMEQYLFSDYYQQFVQFNAIAQKIITEKVFHCVNILGQHLLEIRKNIEIAYSKETDIEILRQRAIEAEYTKATDDLHKQEKRIHGFRDVATGYHEKQ